MYATEFWLEGKMVSCCCAFYLLFENKDCLKASYNDEHCIWEMSGTYEIPNFDVAEGNDEFGYKHVEYMRKDNGAIGSMLSYKVVANNALVINFSSGLEVRLVHEHESEIIEMSA